MELRDFAFALLIVLAGCLASSRGLPSYQQGENDPAVRSSRDIKVPRIVGGKKLSRNAWPFLMVVGNISRDGEDMIQCGGTAIDEYHIVTASHCVAPGHKRQYYVKAGVHDSLHDEDTQQKRLVKKIFWHPDFNPSKIVPDVVVLRLSKPLKRTKAVGWMDLNKNKNCPSEGAKCEVAGWGLQTEGGDDFSAVPKMLELPVRSEKTCSSGFPQYEHDRELCAGPGKKHSDPCNGDSGGPLRCHCGDDQGWVLTGIDSFGHKCGTKDLPEVFVRVSTYYDFIHKITSDKNH